MYGKVMWMATSTYLKLILEFNRLIFIHAIFALVFYIIVLLAAKSV